VIAALVSPAWRRYDVTRVALAQRAHLQGELADRGIEAVSVVVADDENLDIAREYGCVTVEQNNDMLGRRFNDGIHAALELGADIVVVLGSDDWLHPDAFDRLPAAQAPEPTLTADAQAITWTPGPEMVVGAGITVVDLPGARARRCRSRSRTGCVPWLLPRRALEPSGGRPVRETQQRGIDFSLFLGLQVQPTIVVHDPHPLCRVDFKSDTNLNSFDETAGALADGPIVTDPWTMLATAYPEHLVDLARTTHEQMAAVA
jgi:glycosyltransferase involved in cell wall biosynthesis